MSSDAQVEVTPVAESYDNTKDIMMNITLYKKMDGENYKIYIDDKIVVNAPNKESLQIEIPTENKLVLDSVNADNSSLISAIDTLINAKLNPESQVSIKEKQDGGYSSRSVSFRPLKKRRTAKKQKGRK